MRCYGSHSIGYIKQADKVVISPDGLLNIVPFAALLDSNGKYITEIHTITYVTSGRDLLRGRAGIKPETDLFLAANPKFDIIPRVEVSEEAGITRGRFRSTGAVM